MSTHDPHHAPDLDAIDYSGPPLYPAEPDAPMPARPIELKREPAIRVGISVTVEQLQILERLVGDRLAEDYATRRENEDRDELEELAAIIGKARRGLTASGIRPGVIGVDEFYE